MSAAQAADLVDGLTRAGVRSWVMGGWGIDALLRRETRPHHDLDLLVQIDDLARIDTWLRREGFDRRYAWPESQQVRIDEQTFETAFVEGHMDGRELDVHGIEVDDQMRARLATTDPWELPGDTLSGVGMIDGRGVPCVTSPAQVAMHRGYELSDTHRADLRLLGTEKAMPVQAADLPIFDELVRGISQVLGSRLLGLYVYGSAVLGDFDPDVSDIDLLAVTDGLVCADADSALAALHDSLRRRHPAWEDRIEVGYFPWDVLQHFKVRQGEVVRISPGEPLHRTVSLPHWVTDLYSVQEHGVELVGAPKDRFIPTISVQEFKATVRRMLPDWLDWSQGVEPESYQAYVRLTMARSMYAVATGHQTSKVRAAHWMAEQCPEWRIEVSEALRWREEDSQALNADAQLRTDAMVRFTYEATRT